MDQTTLDRLNNKQEMIDLRMAVFGRCLCDLCREQSGVEMHEIISRKLTIGQPEYRIASFQPAICSLLCIWCHHSKATTKQGQRSLIEFNCKLYGVEAVLAAFYAIPERFWRYSIDIEFLKENNASEES